MQVFRINLYTLLKPKYYSQSIVQPIASRFVSIIFVFKIQIQKQNNKIKTLFLM
jgi:hypothetical protein